MVFNSFNFIVVFPFLFLLYYLIPSRLQIWRNIYLLVVSYALYISWKPSFALILLGVTFITYWGGQVLSKEASRKRGSLIWIFSVLGLLPLLVFKYYNFINDSVCEGLSSLGIHFQLPGLNWAIPIGISFYTFQAVGYLLDVYHQRIKAEKDFLIYALFISFFPSIVAGPINKASLVIPQLKSLRPYFDYPKAVEGLKMLLWGMFMKVVVADRVALYADTVFSSYMNYTGLTCFVASIMYTIQIYADFAGYSLMAIGVGKTLGIELTENFRRPYFSVSITEFWHRWHISLSTWLKDYVYIPLGGSRCSKIRNYWNIFVTFLVSGIWHGANWTFIVWGCMHGIIQILEKIFGIQRYSGHSILIKAFRIIITFLLVNFAWIFFRLPTLKDGLAVVSRIFDSSLPLTVFSPGGTVTLYMCIGVVCLFFHDIIEEFYGTNRLPSNSRYRIVRWASYLTIMVVILLCGVFSSDQFIYANF